MKQEEAKNFFFNYDDIYEPHMFSQGYKEDRKEEFEEAFKGATGVWPKNDPINWLDEDFNIYGAEFLDENKVC